MRDTPNIPLRPPSQVMRLARMGSFHQSRLSFMRHLLRVMRNEQWSFTRPVWRINKAGFGEAVYSVTGPDRSYSLVAFSHDIPDHMRSDRVIATMWDATFCLFDGIPDEDDVRRLANNVPKQEAGRIGASELSMSRANKSMRLWNHVVDCLAQGQQPDVNKLHEVGYLMRTTAVYGSGKFGALDRQFLVDRPFARSPFALEMLSVYLTRCCVLDWVEHVAASRGGDSACRLTPDIRQMLGIGNSTGLGMAPFLIHHPALLHSWMVARETALQRVRQVVGVETAQRDILLNCIHRAQINVETWQSENDLQQKKLQNLSDDFILLIQQLNRINWSNSHPWHELVHWSESALSLEGQEQLVSLLLEPYGELVDPLCEDMHINEADYFVIDGAVNIGQLKQWITQYYSWCMQYDFSDPKQNDIFWYVSQEKLEPRVGQRFEEPGAELELPFGIARDVQNLYGIIIKKAETQPLSALLLEHPELRYCIRRIQCTSQLPYAEIRDNLIAHNTLPLDIMRCKLSFFGATKFDPRSDKWLRICMYQNAPFPDQLSNHKDDWVYPQIGQ